MIKRRNEKKKGFSLIELIIVLAVMAIIALIAIPNFTAVKENSKVKADNQSCNAIERSISALLVDESVKGTGTVTITYAAQGKGTPTVVATGLTFDTKVFADNAAFQSYVVDLMDGQSSPQEKDKVSYVVTIDNDKVTSVVTAAKEKKQEEEGDQGQ